MSVAEILNLIDKTQEKTETYGLKKSGVHRCYFAEKSMALKPNE